MFQTIPTQRPSTPLLDTIQNPSDIRDLEEKSLGQLSTELRHFLIYIVGQTGGHFGAGLGVEVDIEIIEKYRTHRAYSRYFGSTSTLSSWPTPAAGSPC